MDYDKSLTEVNDILDKAYENNEISASVYAGFKGSPPPYRNNYQPPKTEPISGGQRVDSEISEAGRQGGIDEIVPTSIGDQSVSDSARMLGQMNIKAAPEGAVGHGMRVFYEMRLNLQMIDESVLGGVSD